MKKKSVRSPKFPFISLKKAIEYIPIVVDLENEGELSRVKIIQKMGFESESGPAIRTFAALRAYDLIDKKRGGLALTSTGKSLIEDPSNLESLQKAALSPLVFRVIWREARDASEEEIAELLFGRRFSEDGAKQAAAIYLENAELANLGSLEVEPDLPERGSRSFPGEGRRGERHRRGRRPEGICLPLSTGPAVIPVGISNDEYEMLLETMKLWKSRIVAS